MADILEKIVEYKKEEVRLGKKKHRKSDFASFELWEPVRYDFTAALKNEKAMSVIAEVKKASPSKGMIREDFRPVWIAEQYAEAGAAAISVLTDNPSFQGENAFLSEIRREIPKPLLRKDFIVDEWQIHEARAIGADAILLIATMLSAAQLQEFAHAAQEIGLHVLTELYEAEEIGKLDTRFHKVVGCNNRDLRTFKVDISRSVKILHQLPEEVIKVSESGIEKAQDVESLFADGIHAVLVGETFMKMKNPGDGVKMFLEPFHQ